MTDTALVIDTVSAVLRLQEMRAEVAARNIALHNVPGAKLERVDVSTQFRSLQEAVKNGTLPQLLEAMQAGGTTQYVSEATAADTGMSLDAQVMEMSAASGRYQALSEGLSRQFALMKLAIGGGR